MSHFPSSRLTTFSALTNPNYRLYWVSQLAASAAVLILALARGWLVYDMTDSPFLLGAVSGAFSIPVIILALPGGAIADRVNKRTLMLITEAIAAFLSLSIALLIATNLVTVWHLVIASFLSGIAFSFGQPAKQAIITEIVGRDKLMNAIALGSTGFNAMRVIAPSVGGFLLAFLGMAPVYFVGTSLALLSILFLLLLPKNIGDPTGPRNRFGDDMLHGVRYMYENKVIFTLLLVTFLPTLLAQPYQFFLPIFARDILKVGQVGLGWMTAMSGIGAVIGTLIIASLGDYSSRARLLLFFMVLMGVLLGLFSFSTVYAFSLFCLLLLGFFLTGFNTLNNTLLQTYSSQEMRGRVMSIMTVAFGVAPLGAIPLGAVAEITSTPLTMAMGGSLVSAIALAIIIFHGSFRQLK